MGPIASLPASAAPVLDDLGATLDSIRLRIDRLGLDLTGMNVITEAATGCYAVTAVIAAMAGAGRVQAVARGGRHGTFAQAVETTLRLARAAGVAHRIETAAAPTPEALSRCDILTNSGHLRPITSQMIGQLPPGAVIALMFEAWEFRDADLDLGACRARGVRLAAVNERHPDVAVFPFLGPLCVKLLTQGGARLQGARVALLCDNPFAAFMLSGLREAGAEAALAASVADLAPGAWDWVVVSLHPERNAPLDDGALAALASKAPMARLAQFWGDVDREAAARHGFVDVCPATPPGKGHMAILLNALGHEPIVRLQAGGLKAAELALRGDSGAGGGVLELV